MYIRVTYCLFIFTSLARARETPKTLLVSLGDSRSREHDTVQCPNVLSMRKAQGKP